MRAGMADLPDYPGSAILTNQQRHAAALTLAEDFADDKHVLCYYLVQLGLATHCEDGTFSSAMDHHEQHWFSRRDDGSHPSFTLPASQLDDCR